MPGSGTVGYDVNDDKYIISASDSAVAIYAWYSDKEILKIMYGDYKKISPLESRLNEMMGHYRRLSQYGLRGKNKNA